MALTSLRRSGVPFVIFVLAALSSVAQQGALKVKLSDKASKETIPFANIILELNGVQQAVATTNIDGEALIKPLTPGKYTVKATYVGYQTVETRDVLVAADKTTYLNPEMSTGVNLKEVEIISYQEPLVDPDTKVSNTVTKEEYMQMASRNINSVAATSAGVYQADDGGALSVRGGRAESNVYFIDGQKVIGSLNLPQQSIEQLTTITGGLPAQYGDATGGVINITTRGPQSKMAVGAQAQSSQFLDAFGYNLVGFNISGPLYSKKDSATGNKKPILGYFFSAQGISEKDPLPSSIGIWKVKDDVLRRIEEAPLVANPNGGFQKAAEFVTKDDMEVLKARLNSMSNNVSTSGKIDFKPTDNLNITFGGSYDYTNRHDFTRVYQLFNYVNNPLFIGNTWRVNARITQRFNDNSKEEEEKSASTIKNAFYSVAGGFTRSTNTFQDDSHKDNLFDYGYIGKFTQTRTPFYAYNPNGKNGPGYYTAAFFESDLDFEPGDKNPTGVAYTKQYYDLVNNEVRSRNDQNFANNAVINGANPINAYMWRTTGRQFPTFQKAASDQFNINSYFSADIKNHAVQVGVEYDQRSNSLFSLDAVSLWTLARQYANLHLADLDTAASPTYNTALSGSINYWDYDLKYDASKQRLFDKKLREKLGKPVDGTEWLDIDSYDPSTFSLDMFSANDLLNNGNGMTYYGYDHTGKKIKGKPSLAAFFDSTKRTIGAYQPIYVAGYIQDKFDFRDLKFNVGVRVDRFDANQPVLKDKYLLYDAKTAGEVNFANLNATRPESISDDYVVYVNDKVAPTKILGYRNEDTWYNEQGVEINDPSIIASNGRVIPYLQNPNAKNISEDAFKDYTPQVTVMPRIALAFPISDVASFSAHYDIITQRPTSAQRFDPSEYYFLENIAVNGAINNPNLKPERTTNYELSFTQVLSEKKNAKLEVRTFYREIRNQIQITQVAQAYPITYTTYGNIDFSTIKGFAMEYELRRSKNVTINANYTLQFAEGTGSGASSGANLVASGQPNLRVAVPLSYDQRHSFVTVLDYRFGNGSDYNGPAITKHKGKENEKRVPLFANMGANFTFRAGSGTPYSKQQGIINTANGGRSGLKGSINGSNLPWNYSVNLRLDKNILLTWGATKEGQEKKQAMLNINLNVLNLLNTKNILGVYAATGNPDDDGFLSSAAAEDFIQAQPSPQAYIDQYEIFINNPGNYSLPRRIRLGIELSF